METYHKIQTLFKRHLDGPKKGKMIKGEWTTPELEYLAGNQWEFTEKIDGTNIRVGFDPYIHPDDQLQFYGRSDNAQIPIGLLDKLNSLFEVKEFYDVFAIDNKPPLRAMLVGEGIGPKIQSSGRYTGDYDFILFDVKVGDYWLDRKNVDDVASKLGVGSVPVIGTGTLHDAIDIVSSGITFNDAGGVKRWGRGSLNSAWGDFTAEGIVARPSVPMFTRKGERVITKIKEVDFK